MRGKRPIRRRSPCIVALAVLVVAACSESGAQPSSKTASTSTVADDEFVPSGVGTFEEALDQAGLAGELAAIRQVNDHVLPLVDALDLFASVFGAMPGGNPDRFSIGPDDLIEGTQVLSSLVRHWEQLTDEQRQAVSAHLGYSQASNLLARPATPADDELQRSVDAARVEIASRLGVELSAPIVATTVAEITTTDADGTVRYWAAEAWPERDGSLALSGRQDTCRIRFAETDRQTIAHEVFHCFQFEIGGDLRLHWAAQDWIVEGSAAWAGTIVGGTDDRTFAWYDDWLEPLSSIFSRDYDAIGFYWVIESMGVSPWSVIGPMLMAGRDVAAVAATGLDPLQVINRVATSKARALTHAIPVDPLWDFSAEQVPEYGLRFPEHVTPADPLSRSNPVAAFAPYGVFDVTVEGGQRLEVDLTADIGTLQFFDRDPITWAGSHNQVYCLEPGGCTCGDTVVETVSRRLIVGGGELDGGEINLAIRIADGGFSDGQWQGIINISAYSYTVRGARASAPATTIPFDLTIVDGAVTAGSFTHNLSGITVVHADGSGVADVVSSGTFSGCGFSPQFETQAAAIEMVMTLPDVGPVAVGGEIPVDETGAPPTSWTFDAGSDPDLVSGEFGVVGIVELLTGLGITPSAITASFAATRVAS